MQVVDGQRSRDAKRVEVSCDLCVVGGGLAGVCSAIAAAREGLNVVLMQDRPVLGGNASSEVRLWVLGATAHMGSPNRWAREAGIHDELLVENMYRNPEGNTLIFDTILLEWVTRESNLTLLLNTAMFDLTKADADTIASVQAWNSQNQTTYSVAAALFVDASGDGVLGFQAGAAFRQGAESADEFGEKFAPDEAYGELLGQSMYFYSKDAGKPVRFVPPSFALKDIEGTIPRYRGFAPDAQGCQLWWIEYGGRLDPVHDTEAIKWELWSVVYGVWNYIKNSGKFPAEQVDNLTLEWVGTIPGKREARRFEGDYLLTQHDVVGRRHHDDTVAHGGWALDLHPADGVYSRFPGCTHWRMSGIYPIAYRCLYSRNITNLFLAGRCISVTHAAFGSTRVMGTLAGCGQAVGVAAAVCQARQVKPRDLSAGALCREMQTRLHRQGQHLIGIDVKDASDAARDATITASSTYAVPGFAGGEKWYALKKPIAQLLPLAAGPAPTMSVELRASRRARITLELRVDQRSGTYLPTELLASTTVDVRADEPITATLEPNVELDDARYAFLIVRGDQDNGEHVEVRLSDEVLTGFVSVIYAYEQNPADDVGIESMAVWIPRRRPEGKNLALRINPLLACFDTADLTNGIMRPVDSPNAWCADPADDDPTLVLTWPDHRTIERMVISVDADWDHAMESALRGHPESVMPMVITQLDVVDAGGDIVATVRDNHQTRIVIEPDRPIRTTELTLRSFKTHAGCPPAIFGIQCFTGPVEGE